MNSQPVESNTLLQFLNEEKYDESVANFGNLFSTPTAMTLLPIYSRIEIVTPDEIKQFMIHLSTVFLKDLNDKSKLNILKLIKAINKFHPNEVLNNLKLALNTIAKFLISGHNAIDGFSGFGDSSCFALQILTTILLQSSPANAESFKNLLQFLILLPSGCILSGKKKIIANCIKLVKNFLQNSFLTEQIVNIVNSSEPKVPFIGFIDIIADIDSIKSQLNKETLIGYVKLCFNDKFVVPANLLKSLKPILLIAIKTRSDFTETLLPIIQRATLRSPEKSLWIINIVLKQIDHLDLSSDSDELSKVFSVQLQSKSESLRAEAKDSLVSVVSHSSESDAIRRVVSLLEKLLVQSGSEKISSVDIRQHIYCTIAELARSVTVGSAEIKDRLSETVLLIVTGLVAKETTESVIVVALDSVTAWSQLATGTVPQTFVTWLRNTIFNAKLSSPVRASFFACLNSCYGRPEKLTGLKSLLPQLQDHLEKSAKSPATLATTQETLPLLELLLRYFVEVEHASDLEGLKTNALFALTVGGIGLRTSAGNARLFSDQLLTSASIGSLGLVVAIVRHALLHLADAVAKLPEHEAAMLRCVAICCMHPDYVAVRRPALDALRQLARSVHGERFTAGVLDYLYQLELASPAAVVACAFWPLDNDGDVTEHDVESLAPVVQRIEQMIDSLMKLEPTATVASSQHHALRALSVGSRFPPWWDSDARARLMERALLPVNQHMVTHFHLDLWARHAQNLLDSTDQICALSGQAIIDRLTSLSRLTSNDRAVIKCICRNFSDAFVNELIDAVTGNLYRDGFIDCSEDEVGIMNTAEGYLFNKVFLHRSVNIY